MAIGSLLFSILTFLYGITSSGFIALFLCILMGPCYQIRDISQTTVLQSSVAPSLLSKMYTAHGTLLSTASGLSMLSVGIITDLFGVRTIYILASILILCSACLSFNLLKYDKTKQKHVTLMNKINRTGFPALFIYDKLGDFRCFVACSKAYASLIKVPHESSACKRNSKWSPVIHISRRYCYRRITCFRTYSGAYIRRKQNRIKIIFFQCKINALFL